MSGAMHLLPNTPSWLGAQLKQRDKERFVIMVHYINIKLDGAITVRTQNRHQRQ
jgi:hypothetical protein